MNNPNDAMRFEDRQAEEMSVESAQDECRLVSSKGSAEQDWWRTAMT